MEDKKEEDGKNMRLAAGAKYKLFSFPEVEFYLLTFEI